MDAIYKGREAKTNAPSKIPSVLYIYRNGRHQHLLGSEKTSARNGGVLEGE